jgi:hypothetical protein
MTTVTITKRKARDLFQAAKLNERQLYPAADRHAQEHGAYPEEYLRAKRETARAFERYSDASYLFGTTLLTGTETPKEA